MGLLLNTFHHLTYASGRFFQYEDQMTGAGETGIIARKLRICCLLRGGPYVDIHENILKTIGNTPLIRLSRFFKGEAVLAAKVESFNPGSSVKDRIGLSLIEAAEQAGKLKPGGTIVEPTSGNTGVGLAIAALLRGYKLVCTASDKIPPEKIALLEAYGAEVITCPAEVPPEDPRSYYRMAEKVRDERGAFLPNQYANPANPEAHYRTTGPEIWRQTGGKITHWVTSIGTGGTISGTGKYLKEKSQDIRSPESGSRVTTIAPAERGSAICRAPAAAAPPDDPQNIPSVRVSSMVVW